MVKLFTSKKQILELVKRAENFSETRILVQKFKKLKTKRNKFYITSNEFEEILKWKLRTQYGRQSKIREQNKNENIILITRAAFGVTHKDENFEIKLKLEILKTICGVHIPVASAILALCYPDSYAVIDYRNWKQIFPKRIVKSNYSSSDYLEYLKTIRDMAFDFGLSPQQIDIAIWQKDIEKNK